MRKTLELKEIVKLTLMSTLFFLDQRLDLVKSQEQHKEAAGKPQKVTMILKSLIWKKKEPWSLKGVAFWQLSALRGHNTQK